MVAFLSRRAFDTNQPLASSSGQCQLAFLMGLDRRRLLGHGAGGVGSRNPHWSSDYCWTTAWS
jgi:hypothetical protein